MRVWKFLYIFIALIGFAKLSFALDEKPNMTSNKCINGPYEKNINLKNSFECSMDYLRMSYLSETKQQSPYENCLSLNNRSCENKNLKDQTIRLDQVFSNLDYTNFSTLSSKSLLQKELPTFKGKVLNQNTATSPSIAKECILASMKRLPGNKGYVCGYDEKEINLEAEPGDQKIQKYYGRASGNTAQCIDDSMVDYMHYSVNMAIKCFSNIAPIDSKTIFKIINNETAFNLSISSRDGRGIGQITTPAAAELTHPKLGNGKYILKSVMQNPNPACTPFRNIAENDLRDGPPLKNRLKSICAWVNPGDGLARNLMYTIGYYLTLRDHYIKGYLEKRNKSLAENTQLLNDLTAVAYGREGLKKVRALIDNYRVGPSSDAKTLSQAFRSESKYLNEINLKMKEMYCQMSAASCKSDNLPTEALEGDLCVSQ